MRLEGYVHGFEIDADHSLHIYQGSLVRVQADALVSSDNNYLSAEVGVSLALALAAGFDVDRERQQIVREHRPTLGEVVRTSGGGLPCRYLYHAITAERNAHMDEAALRKLIANLLKQATADGVRSIGMPALGTGAVSFKLDRASEIIIDELLIRLVDTPIQRVILALMGNEAERLFYESIVRSRADRLATIALRHRERHAGEPATPPGPAGSNPAGLTHTGLTMGVEPDVAQSIGTAAGRRSWRRPQPDYHDAGIEAHEWCRRRARASPTWGKTTRSTRISVTAVFRSIFLVTARTVQIIGAIALRRRERHAGEPATPPGPTDAYAGEPATKIDRVRPARVVITTDAYAGEPATTYAGEPATPPGPAGAFGAAAGETVEQFPNLIDETRLSSTPPNRPKLVDGLADLILRHADPDDIERELLSSPACRGFQGTLKQRVMEFLYLSEDNLRKALGPTLFKNKDLREMVRELGEDSDLPRDQDQLLVAILRTLCFNTLAPPVGIGEYIARLERVLADLRGGTSDERALLAAAVEAGKVLEQALKDLLRLYGFLFFGGDFEAELVRRQVVAPRRDDNHLSRLTIGQALEGLEQLNSLMNRDATFQAKWRALGRLVDELLPRRIGAEQGIDCRQVLRQIIAARNASVHTGGTDGTAEPDEMVQKIQMLHAFFCACQETGIYPDVLCYEGTYENRNGERFVYFLDEKGRERKVRTDEKIDARRHYYCFATNNPIYLHPTLIPKLY